MAQEPPTHPQRPTKQPAQQFPLWIMYASITAAFAWLLFLAFWLFYWATSFSILQNLGVFLLSVIILGILETLLWVPWSMRHAH